MLLFAMLLQAYCSPDPCIVLHLSHVQLRMDQFLSFNQRFAKIRSKRLQQAVAGITGQAENPGEDAAWTRSALKTQRAHSTSLVWKKHSPSGCQMVDGGH